MIRRGPGFLIFQRCQSPSPLTATSRMAAKQLRTASMRPAFRSDKTCRSFLTSILQWAVSRDPETSFAFASTVSGPVISRGVASETARGVSKERLLTPVPRQPAIRSGCGARMAGNSTWCSRVGPRGRRSVPSLTGNSQTGQTSAINRRREDVGETAGTRAGQAARRSYRWCRPPSSGRATIFPMVGGYTSLGSGASLLRDRCVRDLW